MVTVEYVIDRLAGALMAFTFAFAMTGALALNQPTASTTMVEGIGFTVEELGLRMVGLAAVCLFTAIAIVPLFVVLPHNVLQKNLSWPSVSVDW